MDELRKQFYEHMELCGVCTLNFDRCWRMDEILRAMIEASE